MHRTAIACALTLALASVPSLATAEPADLPAPGSAAPGLEHHCSQHPYVEELKCRVHEAICALICTGPAVRVA